MVALDACTEHGDQFMTTHSYLPSEIHWGFTFVNIVRKAAPPSTHHTIDIGKCVAPLAEPLGAHVGGGGGLLHSKPARLVHSIQLPGPRPMHLPGSRWLVLCPVANAITHVHASA